MSTDFNLITVADVQIARTRYTNDAFLSMFRGEAGNTGASLSTINQQAVSNSSKAKMSIVAGAAVPPDNQIKASSAFAIAHPDRINWVYCLDRTQVQQCDIAYSVPQGVHGYLVLPPVDQCNGLALELTITRDWASTIQLSTGSASTLFTGSFSALRILPISASTHEFMPHLTSVSANSITLYPFPVNPGSAARVGCLRLISDGKTWTISGSMPSLSTDNFGQSGLYLDGPLSVRAATQTWTTDNTNSAYHTWKFTNGDNDNYGRLYLRNADGSDLMTLDTYRAWMRNAQVTGPNGNNWTMDTTSDTYWHKWYFSTTSTQDTPRLYLANPNASSGPYAGVNLYCKSVVAANNTLSFTGGHIAQYVGEQPLTDADIGKAFMLTGALARPTEICQSTPCGVLCDVDCCTSVYGIIADIRFLDENAENHGEIVVHALGEGGALVHDSATQMVDIQVGDLLVSAANGCLRKLQPGEPESQRYIVARSLETYRGPSPYMLAVAYRCA